MWKGPPGRRLQQKSACGAIRAWMPREAQLCQWLETVRPQRQNYPHHHSERSRPREEAVKGDAKVECLGGQDVPTPRSTGEGTMLRQPGV